MPEWTVQKIRWVSNAPKDHRGGRHCIQCNNELWEDFNFDSCYNVVARINSILDLSGKVLSTIKQDYFLHPKLVYVLHTDMSDYPIRDYGSYRVLFFSDEFVKEYGLRKGEVVDLVLIGLSNTNKVTDISQAFYPKRFIVGRIDIQPTGGAPKLAGVIEPLIEQNLEGTFYRDLIQEINLAYSYQLHRSTLVLIRKLLENLLIDLLRTKFGSNRIELFYNKDRAQFVDFYNLLENIKQNKNEFAPFTAGLTNDFFDVFNLFRDKANANVHALETFLDPKIIDENKAKLNHYVNVVKNAIDVISKAE